MEMHMSRASLKLFWLSITLPGRYGFLHALYKPELQLEHAASINTLLNRQLDSSLTKIVFALAQNQ
jgi:hypothetical protein